MPTGGGIMEGEIPLVHACGTFSQVPRSVQMPPMDYTLFTHFLKGNGGGVFFKTCFVLMYLSLSVCLK